MGDTKMPRAPWAGLRSRHARWWALRAAGGLLLVTALTAVLFLVKHSQGGLAAPPTRPATHAASVQPSAEQRSPDGIALAPLDAAAVRTSSAPTAWGGPRSGKEPTLSDRVVEYRIDAKLDPEAHTIEGKQQMVWRNRSDRPIRSIYMHLYLNAFEGEGSTFMTEQRNLGFGFRSDVRVDEGDWGFMELRRVEQGGAAVPWRFVQPDGGPATDRTVVRLDLPVPVPPGETTTLDIEFFDQLPRVVARTGHFGSFHLVAQWFPKVAVLELPGERGATELRWNAHEFHLHSEFYADFGSFDVRIDVPQAYTVGATGEEIAPVQRNAGRAVYRFAQGDVHDFAWTADHRTAAPLEGSYTGEGSPPVKIKVLFPPEYASNAQPVLQATKDALAYFSKTLGPYPYRTVTAVIPPFNAQEAGGMEYPTFFTASGYANLEPGTAAAYALDFVTIHEFGHGYFYGILASNEFEEPMLDEGLNEFVNLRMMRERGQRIPLATGWLKRQGFAPSLDPFEAERLATVAGEAVDPLGQNSWHRLSSQSYGSVYSRSATVMRDLESRIGSEAMGRALALYYQRWKFRHPSIADWRDVLIEASGQRDVVDQVFNQHVYGVGRVDDRIHELRCEEELPLLGRTADTRGAKGLTATQRDAQIEAARQAWAKAHPKPTTSADAKPRVQPDAASGPFPWRTSVVVRRQGVAIPQTLKATFADGTVETVQWHDDARWKRFSWVKPAKVVRVELDPDGLHSMDVSRLDNSRTLRADSTASRRLATEFGAILQAAFAALTIL